MRQFSFIVIVLCALAASIALLRKRGAALKVPRFAKRTRRLEIVERLALSQHASLVLVRLDEREILIANCGTGCSILEERKMASGAAA